MSVWQRIRERVGSGRAARTPGEAEGSADTATAGTRATGGVADPEASNPNSTTGTTSSETFVGRASGDESGDAGLSGAEARAEHERRKRSEGNPDRGS